jgi:microcystin-dependent protein
MAEPFMGEIRLFSFNFAPQGWSLCNGQLLPINQNQALFSLLGTTYGGDGRVNFGLPDLRGRTPIHMGGTHTLGERAGEQGHTLNISELPTHTHSLRGSSTTGNAATVANNVLATSAALLYSSGNLTSLQPGTIPNIGGNQAHLNMQPYLVINFCIALVGIFPSQT